MANDAEVARIYVLIRERMTREAHETAEFLAGKIDLTPIELCTIVLRLVAERAGAMAAALTSLGVCRDSIHLAIQTGINHGFEQAIPSATTLAEIKQRIEEQEPKYDRPGAN